MHYIKASYVSWIKYDILGEFIHIRNICFFNLWNCVLVTNSNSLCSQSIFNRHDIAQHELEIATVAIHSLWISLDLWLELITSKRTSNYMIYSHYLKLSYENQNRPLTTNNFQKRTANYHSNYKWPYRVNDRLKYMAVQCVCL